MGTYYLDIETTGLNPDTSKIITIQYQKLERNTGVPKGSLIILKEWQLGNGMGGEEEVVRRFIENTPITSGRDFDFVPVGYNLKFEHKFLSAKSKKYGLDPIDIINDRPTIDLHATGVMMNRCEFAGSGLDRLTGKAQSGSKVVEWYRNREYDKIMEYIQDETLEFSKFFVWLCRELPMLHKKFKSTTI